ncbi:hypothetical protein SCIP_0911 [Scardovia inopinata JCM 12537]|nr:hypothetical protein SCIP_0911 [Scardovia inopinata JCM 12537]
MSQQSYKQVLANMRGLVGKIIQSNLPFFSYSSLVESGKVENIKILSEFFIYLLVTQDKSNKLLYSKNNPMNLHLAPSIDDSLYEQLLILQGVLFNNNSASLPDQELTRSQYDSLLPHERIQYLWILNQTKPENLAIKIKEALLESNASRQTDLYYYDFADLYYLTHSIFFACDFGKTDIHKFIGEKIIEKMIQNILADIVFALKLKHDDLCAELFICVASIKEHLRPRERELCQQLFEFFYHNRLVPFLSKPTVTFSKKTDAYHISLVLGMLGASYANNTRG